MKLSEGQVLMLRVAATRGPHGVGLMGAANWRTARSLVAAGLGEIVEKNFVANAAGAHIIA